MRLICELSADLQSREDRFSNDYDNNKKRIKKKRTDQNKTRSKNLRKARSGSNLHEQINKKRRGKQK